MADDREAAIGKYLAETGRAVEFFETRHALHRFDVVIIDVTRAIRGDRGVVAIFDETARGFEIAGFPGGLHVAFESVAVKDSRAGADGA